MMKGQKRIEPSRQLKKSARAACPTLRGEPGSVQTIQFPLPMAAWGQARDPLGQCDGKRKAAGVLLGEIFLL